MGWFNKLVYNLAKDEAEGKELTSKGKEFLQKVKEEKPDLYEKRTEPIRKQTKEKDLESRRTKATGFASLLGSSRKETTG